MTETIAWQNKEKQVSNQIQSDGPIYTNSYKSAPNQPDWTGTVTVSKELLKEMVTRLKGENAASVEMRVAMWDRVSKQGNEYKYARVELKRQQNREPEPTPDPEDDDEIPF